MQRFVNIAPSPHITLTLPWYWKPTIYSDFSGVKTPPYPETDAQLHDLVGPPGNTVVVNGSLTAVPDAASPPGTTIASVTMAFPGPNGGTVSSMTATSPGIYPIVWPANFLSMVGVSTLTVVDSNGGTTISPIDFVALTVTANVANSSAACPSTLDLTFYTTKKLYSWTVESTVGSTLGSNYNPVFPTPTLFPVGLSTATVPLQVVSDPGGNFYTFIVTDVDGNQMHYAQAVAYTGGPCLFGNLGGPYPGVQEVFQGTYPNIPLARGVSASNLAVVNEADLSLFVAADPPQLSPGWQSAMPTSNTLALNILPNTVDYNPNPVQPYAPAPFTLNVPLDPALTAAQLNYVQVAFVNAATGNIAATEPAVVSSGTSGPIASFTVPSNPNVFSQTFQFLLTAPSPVNPIVLSTAGVALLYNASGNPGLSLALANPAQPPLASLASAASAAGLTPASPFVVVGPFGTALASPADLTLPASAPGGAIYELTPGQPLKLLPNQYAGVVGQVSVPLNSIDSYYAVFTATAANAQLVAGGGRALAADNSGQLYEVVASTAGSPVWLSIFNSSGVFISSATLPQAVGGA